MGPYGKAGISPIDAQKRRSDKIAYGSYTKPHPLKGFGARQRDTGWLAVNG
jgi:hypothetical protein